ncbi:MAG: tetratricopeptide repeat protein [Candidatus Obscuribacter sp.]|jgi:tetratricopeptide (TPR) repeat protein|nr:tetratricopeptide repeat protein [Candidatus Obscuribacter sp.]MBK9619832.1 tetratricopeptide repeat protein [Candidatus Obscuribacter sp.]MBP6352047.1 tetratricopeptide repeat protein [Candidatus Obscuribacter sp.]MBP6594779.1 tetratricopeptide repeat protein [Candidatus Obscuribacter sp.]MDQ5964959.1 Tetratricopeptide repeat protein [Cyanobacteriota bacterium erpe_2018_sw_39hr_WHONDRS-SW48-000098_B_bin.30]
MIEKLKLMGDSALSRGLYDEAEGYYQRALDGLGNSSEEPLVAEALRGIARCCLARGDYVKAERSANRAMAIDEDYWGPGCAQVGDSYFIMAEASRYQGALGRAEYFYGSALEYKRFHLGDDHAEVALIYARLCLTSLIHGLSPGLDELIALCHHNFKRVPTARDFVSYLDLREMLVYLLEANRNLEAEQLYKQSISAFARLFGTRSLEVVELERAYGHACQSRAGQSLMLNWKTRVHDTTSRTDDNLDSKFETLMAQKQYEQAEQVLVVMLRVARDRHGEHSPEVLHCLQKYVRLLRLLNRPEDLAVIEKSMSCF